MLSKLKTHTLHSFTQMRMKCIFRSLKLTYASYSDLVESVCRIVYVTISFSKLNPRSTSLCFNEGSDPWHFHK